VSQLTNVDYSQSVSDNWRDVVRSKTRQQTN